MKLSILIPLYNKEKYIERCLKSLLAQDISPNEYEIIIVDDGSKDSGVLIVQNYAEKNANIQLISQQNQGPSAARNRCLEAAEGDYLYFLDADDYLATNVLNSLLELGAQHDLEILEFNTKQITEGTILESLPQNPHDVSIDSMDGITYVAEYGFRNEAWRYFVKKGLLTDTGIKFIEGTLYEDAIFTASLFLKASRMAKVNMDVHRYVIVENSIVTSKDPAHNLKFIHGMVYAIEHFHGLIKGLNSSHVNCHKVVKKLKGRQQALVFALIIRTLKYRLLSFKDLEKILAKLNTLEAYPIDTKIGGIGEGKASIMYTMIFVPIFNTKAFLFLGMGIMRLIPTR
jgi:glycosyltransferase involved in cell wall biosynthesis